MKIKGKRSQHVCEVAVVKSGDGMPRYVKTGRVEAGGDLRPEIEEGKVTVEARLGKPKVEKVFSKGEKRSKSGLILPGGSDGD